MSPKNGEDTGVFFTYDLKKAKIHRVQSNSGVVVKEVQLSNKRNFNDSNSLFGSHEEKAHQHS